MWIMYLLSGEGKMVKTEQKMDMSENSAKK